MALNSCPCMDIERGVKVYSIIDIALGGSFTILATTLLILVSLNKTQLEYDETTKFSIILVLGFALAVKLFEVGLACMLYIGANRRRIRICNIWLILTGILLGISIIVTLSKSNMETSLLEFFWFMFWMGFKIYGCFLVFDFKQHVSDDEEKEICHVN